MKSKRSTHRKCQRVKEIHKLSLKRTRASKSRLRTGLHPAKNINFSRNRPNDIFRIPSCSSKIMICTKLKTKEERILESSSPESQTLKLNANREFLNLVTDRQCLAFEIEDQNFAVFGTFMNNIQPPEVEFSDYGVSDDLEISVDLFQENSLEESSLEENFYENRLPEKSLFNAEFRQQSSGMLQNKIHHQRWKKF